MSVCIFVLLLGIPSLRIWKRVPQSAARLAGKLLAFLSQTTLLTYLLSDIFDSIFYPQFNTVHADADYPARFRLFLHVQPKSYLCSLLCAIPVMLLYHLMQKLICSLPALRRVKKEKQE